MAQAHPLNGICPYYTMFPLIFPQRILRQARRPALAVDPFCGRGTTLFAARECRLAGYGIDTSPVAVAISRAKLTAATGEAVMAAYDSLMRGASTAPVPQGPFWQWAYHPDTLASLCALRAALIHSAEQDQEPAAITVLRGIALGALHGPLHKGPTPSTYFSNQMMRSFALKPDYAVRYWTMQGLRPPFADIRAVVDHRVQRLLQAAPPLRAPVQVRQGDAREPASYAALPGAIDWVVTSPPYLGMATYEVDQWLRLWFLGGPDRPVYRNPNQLSHHDAPSFARALATVWDRIAEHASPDLRMVIRFGAIGSRQVDYSALLRHSLELSAASWRLTANRSAGHAAKGRRQSLSMGRRGHSQALEERDFYVRL